MRSRMPFFPRRAPGGVLAICACELALAYRHLFAERIQIHLRLARLGKHAARLLFFLHVMFDHLGQHLDLRVEVLVVRARRVDLRNQLLRAVMLDLGLVMQILVIGGLEKRRVEDLFLDGGMHLECVADVGRELELAAIGARLFELLEPLLDLAVIRLQQRNRVLRLRAACVFDFRSRHDRYSLFGGEHVRRLRMAPIAKDHGDMCKVHPTSLAIPSHL